MKSTMTAALAILFLACNPIQESHVEENVPDRAAFDQTLRRDLTAYFGGAEVTIDLLRREATQSGVAYPKFYAWVKAAPLGKSAVEGAARIAAVDREKFEVTDFLTAEGIRANPGQVDTIFPAPLCPVVKRRAGVPGV